jgi:hypothetical protein
MEKLMDLKLKPIDIKMENIEKLLSKIEEKL